MAENIRNLLLVSDRKEESAQWASSLTEAGWSVQTVTTFEQLVSYPGRRDYHIILLVTDSAGDSIIRELIDCGDEQLLSGLLLPIVNSASGEEVISLIRAGVHDLLIRPFPTHDLLKSVARVSDYRDLVQENVLYRSKLEAANRELRESLVNLRLDQMAGRQVQQSLLPPTPMHHGEYTIAHRIVPSLYLSGDFVGYHVVFDRYLLFYFADVSGHGASSAFITILLRFILRRIVRNHVRDRDFKAVARAPSGFIEHINRQLLGTGLEKHLTIFAGSIDMNNHFLRYAVGAQLPMPLFVVGEDARFLPGKGKPVGIYENATWDVEEIALPARFSLAIPSDGILDLLPGDNLAAKEEQLLKAASGANMDHDKLCHALGMDSVTEAPDDISILTVTRGH